MILTRDELADVTNTVQVLFIWDISAEFRVTEELASMNTLYGTTMGIF